MYSNGNSFGSSATGGSAHNEIGGGKTGVGAGLSGQIFAAGPDSVIQKMCNPL